MLSDENLEVDGIEVYEVESKVNVDKKKNGVVVISDKVVKSLRDIRANFDDDLEEVERIGELMKAMGSDSVVFAVVYLSCYDALENNAHKFKNESGDYSGMILSYLRGFDVGVRKQIEAFGGGSEIGDYWIKRDIIDLVEKNRGRFWELINFYVKVFGGGDD